MLGGEKPIKAKLPIFYRKGSNGISTRLRYCLVF
jgi:hypothetical protein